MFHSKTSDGVPPLAPAEILTYKTNFGASLDITLSLFKQVIQDTIDSCWLTHFHSTSQDYTKTAFSPSLALQKDYNALKHDLEDNEYITCTVCKRSISCSKYAPHLEKCLGIGRAPARAASVKKNFGLEDDDSEFEILLDQMQNESSNNYISSTKRKKGTVPLNKQPKTVTIRPVEDQDLFDCCFVDLEL